jgi:hypothetical protein
MISDAATRFFFVSVRHSYKTAERLVVLQVNYVTADAGRAWGSVVVKVLRY